MARIGIQQNITNKLIKDLYAFQSDVDSFIKAEIAGIGFQIENDSKQNASSIEGIPPEIKQGISHEITNNGYSVSVNQNALPMGAYIEFGTGVYVTVSPEWKDLAWQFYVNGKGRLHAHPYMYPAYQKARKDFQNTIRRKIDQLTNKFNQSK